MELAGHHVFLFIFLLIVVHQNTKANSSCVKSYLEINPIPDHYYTLANINVNFQTALHHCSWLMWSKFFCFSSFYINITRKTVQHPLLIIDRHWSAPADHPNHSLHTDILARYRLYIIVWHIFVSYFFFPFLPMLCHVITLYSFDINPFCKFIFKIISSIEVSNTVH